MVDGAFGAVLKDLKKQKESKNLKPLEESRQIRPD